VIPREILFTLLVRISLTFEYSEMPLCLFMDAAATLWPPHLPFYSLLLSSFFPCPSFPSFFFFGACKILERLLTVNFAKQSSIHSARKRFKIDRRNIREWMSNENKLVMVK
jgi:hypothetical protein